MGVDRWPWASVEAEATKATEAAEAAEDPRPDRVAAVRKSVGRSANVKCKCLAVPREIMKNYEHYSSSFPFFESGKKAMMALRDGGWTEAEKDVEEKLDKSPFHAA